MTRLKSTRSLVKVIFFDAGEILMKRPRALPLYCPTISSSSANGSIGEGLTESSPLSAAINCLWRQALGSGVRTGVEYCSFSRGTAYQALGVEKVLQVSDHGALIWLKLSRRHWTD